MCHHSLYLSSFTIFVIIHHICRHHSPSPYVSSPFTIFVIIHHIICRHRTIHHTCHHHSLYLSSFTIFVIIHHICRHHSPYMSSPFTIRVITIHYICHCSLYLSQITIFVIKHSICPHSLYLSLFMYKCNHSCIIVIINEWLSLVRYSCQLLLWLSSSIIIIVILHYNCYHSLWFYKVSSVSVIIIFSLKS